MADIEQLPAPVVPADQLSILRHTLGVGEDGCAPSYRNHFVTGEGGIDHSLCMALVAGGLMTRHSGNALTGGSDVFGATNAGRLAAVGTPPKLSRSQQRYREYLRTDSNLTFIEWLRSPYCMKVTTLATVKPPRDLRTRLREDV